MYPDDEDFPVYITTLSLMRTTNPMLVLKVIKTEIIDPYGAKINARDESFFLEEDYTQKKDLDLNIVEKLKQYIRGMNTQTKETVWKYIEIITKLCSKAIE